jgi:hypothetical protein
MSRMTTEKEEQFFQELDRAFNTPATEALIIPQIPNNDAPDPFIASTDSRQTKRQISHSELKDTKRRRSSLGTENIGKTTGVGIRPRAHERSRSAKRPPPVKRRSSGTSLKQAGKENNKQKKSDLLSGMILFFIPNSKKNGVRRFRMTLFAQHGAGVRDTWTEDITHIICDKSITGERVLRDLQWEQFPVSLLPKN